jgi:membrane protein implicated in regulation of membrane protease activity
MENIFSLGLYWHWIIAGLVLIGIELIILPGAFFLWVGLAALIVGALAWLTPLSLVTQLLVFSPLALLITWAGKSITRKNIQSDAPLLNKRQEQLVGRVIILSSPIVAGQAQVTLGDSVWSVRGPDLPAGRKVVVVAVEGNALIVVEQT